MGVKDLRVEPEASGYQLREHLSVADDCGETVLLGVEVLLRLHVPRGQERVAPTMQPIQAMHGEVVLGVGRGK